MINKNNIEHQSSENLHDYFSKWPACDLSPEQRQRIARHIEACVECFIAGEVIQDLDETRNEELAQPPSLEEEIILKRTLAQHAKMITKTT